MAYTRKQLVTCISIVYLVFATALAGYASSRANKLSLPIPNILTGFATALPLVSGLLLEAGFDLNRVGEKRKKLPKGSTPRPPLVIIANTLIFIYSTVVITLLGTHVGPISGLRCGLEERWTALFKHKEAEAIRTIQEMFNCCGFVNSHDRAWPFPDKGHDSRACERAFGRSNGCLPSWRGEEQRVAGTLMGVVGLVFVWQMAIIATPTQRESWLHRVLPDRVSNLIADEENGSGRPRRAIDYLPNFHRYRDDLNGERVAEEVEDDEGESTPQQRAIDQGVQTARDGLPGTIREQQVEHSPLDNAWART